jgi:ribonuclease BN (tRNA processing enzyme)
MITKSIKRPLKLKNDGKLELVFIGTGSSFADHLYNTNFILIKGDTHILVDFGVTGPIALSDITGLKSSDIENFLPTHSHSDHIGGVEYLSLANRYITVAAFKGKKLKMIITKEYQKVLWDMSLKGGMQWNEVNEDGKYLNLDDYFDIVNPKEIKDQPRRIWRINYGGIEIEMFRTIHIPEQALIEKDAFLSYGLYVDNRLFISCDTKFDRELIDFYADRSEVLFHDASLKPNPVHACIDELKTLPDSIRKKMYLMDYSDNWEDVKIDEFAGFAIEGKRYIFD